MGDVSYIFQPGTKGGGHGECIIFRAAPLALDSVADLGDRSQVATYLEALNDGEPIALELRVLGEGDVDRIRAFAEEHGRSVVARKADE